ncbi:hypothetical protein [Streptomyces sp. NPDC005009]
MSYSAGQVTDLDRRLLSAPVTDRMTALTGVVRALEEVFFPPAVRRFSRLSR